MQIPAAAARAAAILLLALAAGCGGAAAPALRPPTAVPARVPASASITAVRHLSGDALAAELARGRVLLLDVRTVQDYTARRLPGARSFPLYTAAAHLAELPRDRPLVVYCA